MLSATRLKRPNGLLCLRKRKSLLVASGSSGAAIFAEGFDARGQDDQFALVGHRQTASNAAFETDAAERSCC